MSCTYVSDLMDESIEPIILFLLSLVSVAHIHFGN
jgi:hypothetical protein